MDMRHTSVLIVDDDATMLRLLRTLLKQIDIQDVEEATDGLQALSKLRGRRFGIVISDWHMQPMSGFELLEHVRRDTALAKLPFIMVTAECAPDRVTAARQAQVSSYIVKPFSAETFKKTILTACAYD